MHFILCVIGVIMTYTVLEEMCVSMAQLTLHLFNPMLTYITSNVKSMTNISRTC